MEDVNESLRISFRVGLHEMSQREEMINIEQEKDIKIHFIFM